MQNIPSGIDQIDATPTSVDEPDEPLGPGATLVSSVFAALVGIVVGVITTFTHGQLAPWGLVAGLVIVLALVVGFRLVFGSRAVAAAAALGVVGASAVLALPGAGGRVLALTGWLGYLWAFGPAVLSAIALLVPAPGRRRRA